MQRRMLLAIDQYSSIPHFVFFASYPPSPPFPNLTSLSQVEADRGEDLGTIYRSLPLSEYLQALFEERQAKAAKIAENGGGGGGGDGEGGKKKRSKPKKNEVSPFPWDWVWFGSVRLGRFLSHGVVPLW